MKIQEFTGKVALAGTRECPSTARRLRCPRCYALLHSFMWDGHEGQCAVCKTALATIPLRPGFWGYFFTVRGEKSIIWQLFYVFVWVPLMLLDHYLGLMNLPYYAVIRVMS